MNIKHEHQRQDSNMMMNTTITQLQDLRMAGMALGLQEQLGQAGMSSMSFEERIALLVDREVHHRNDKRQTRLLKDAKLKYPQACIEDFDLPPPCRTKVMEQSPQIDPDPVSLPLRS